MNNQNPKDLFNAEEFAVLKNFAQKSVEEDRAIHGIKNPPKQQQQFQENNKNQFSNPNVTKNMDKIKIFEPKNQENINKPVFHQTNIQNNPNQSKNSGIYVNNNNKEEYFNENIKKKVEKEEEELLSSFNNLISGYNKSNLIIEKANQMSNNNNVNKNDNPFLKMTNQPKKEELKK